jgi:hypothetical protein
MFKYKLNVEYLAGKKYKMPKGTSIMVDKTGVYLVSNKELSKEDIEKIGNYISKKNKKGGS